MIALVTGGAGFIGSHVAELLIEAGFEVRVLDDLSTGSAKNLDCLPGNVLFIERSILEPDIVRLAAEGCAAVFHLAAIANVPRSIEDPVGTNRVNIDGTAVVAQAATDAGAKLIFSSSAAVYGNPQSQPVSEDFLPETLSPYAVQKLASEGLLRSFHETHGLKSVSLRYFNVYGPRQDPNSDYAAVVPKFVANAIEGEPLTIFGDGAQTRDFVFARDVARANLMAFESGVEDGRPINIASGRSISVLDLASSINGAADSVSELDFQPSRQGEVLYSRADVSRAKVELGFEASVSLEEGLRQTIEYWRSAVPA